MEDISYEQRGSAEKSRAENIGFIKGRRTEVWRRRWGGWRTFVCEETPFY